MKKVVLKIVLIIILQESELIHMIIYLLKKYWLFIILIKSFVYKKLKNYVILEKGLYKDKSSTEYF